MRPDNRSRIRPPAWDKSESRAPPAAPATLCGVPPPLPEPPRLSSLPTCLSTQDNKTLALIDDLRQTRAELRIVLDLCPTESALTLTPAAKGDIHVSSSGGKKWTGPIIEGGRTKECRDERVLSASVQNVFGAESAVMGGCRGALGPA